MTDAPIGGLRDGCIGPLLIGLGIAILFSVLLWAMAEQPPTQPPPGDTVPGQVTP
jgi:hypothetical protein